MEQPKKNKVRVLVFPCGTEIGLEIHRALCQSTQVELVGASSVSSNHGAYLFDHYVEGIPFVSAPEFVAEMSALVASNAIDYLYPAHDDAVVGLARHASAIGCEIITSPLHTCELCRDKSATYARFAQTLPVPRCYPPDHPDPPFPVFLKPNKGQGSRGVSLAGSRAAWAAALEGDPSLIALEYLPGQEYTVDCFTDREGVLRFIGPRERVRTMNGISVHTRPVPVDEFSGAARIINETLALRGAWFFQMKRGTSGQPALLEIAPRVSGGMGLYRNLGVNLPLLSVFDRLGIDVDIRPLSHALEMDRALFARFRSDLQYGHVYMDLDDTLLCRGKVNTVAVAFLFQCRNQGKRLHLLTRHAGCIEDTLARHRLSGVFDTVTLVAENKSKADYIQHQDALFIDDSFVERRAVQEATGIPVFAPDALESLLDWRS